MSHTLPLKLVFATNNRHKIEEATAILGTRVTLLSLQDIDCHDELPETMNTFEGNALQKARYIHEHYGVDCMADDSGLEVRALNGAPGVFSARYALLKGTADQAHNDLANTRQLLHDLDSTDDRTAQFRTVTALILGEQEYTFEGIVRGRIALTPAGSQGFGYDPVFIPEGYEKTFAQLPPEVKNQISHRARSLEAMKKFLATL